MDYTQNLVEKTLIVTENNVTKFSQDIKYSWKIILIGVRMRKVLFMLVVELERTPAV